MLQAALVVASFGSVGSIEARAETAVPCKVHVMLFVPGDVKPPTNHHRRIDEIVGYAESFFQRELARWGHQKSTMPFRRKPDGRVEVTMVRGKQRTSYYKPVTVRAEVMDGLRRQGKL